MGRHFRPKLQIAILAILLFGISFGIHAKYQPNLPGKIALAQAIEQAEGQPAADVIGHWQAFAARSAAPMAVSWSRRTGTPESIFGELSEPVGKVSVEAARRFLAENRSLFKMESGLQDLALARSFESPMGHHFVFQQTYRGVLVYGAQAAVHFNRAGRVVAVNNTYLPGIELASVEPTVSLDRALDIARAGLLRDNLSQASISLVVYAFNGSFSLAWQVGVPTSGPTWELFIDAHSGALLGSPRDINRYATGTGQVFKVNAIVATHDTSLRDNNDAASAVPNSAYISVTLDRLAGNGFLDGLYASSSDTKQRVFSSSNTFNFDRSSDGFSETMGYYYIDYAENYIQTTLGFTNVNNRQQVFSVNRYKKDNSFYSPNSKSITYGTGGVDDAEDAEVILHEYGHSIQDNEVPGFGSSQEAGSMGEGFGDYWSGSVNAQLSGGYSDLCIAEWDSTSYATGDPPCLRRLDSTKHYPENVVGEVHADGEMWSASLWQIRTSIGALKADKLILQAHFLLTPSASFNQGANALVTAAQNLGYNSKDVSSIRTILQNRGFTVTV